MAGRLASVQAAARASLICLAGLSRARKSATAGRWLLLLLLLVPLFGKRIKTSGKKQTLSAGHRPTGSIGHEQAHEGASGPQVGRRIVCKFAAGAWWRRRHFA